MRVGMGFDVHAFDPTRQLVLGGVPIAGAPGLAGWSDADALTHAIAAALIVGRHPVAEALRAGVALHHLYLAEGMRPSPVLDEIVQAAERAKVAVAFESRATLNRRAPGLNHQGVVAEVNAFRYASMAGLLARPVRR